MTPDQIQKVLDSDERYQCVCEKRNWELKYTLQQAAEFVTVEAVCKDCGHQASHSVPVDA